METIGPGTTLAVKPKSSLAAQTFAAVEGYKADDNRGKEGIDSNDLRLPFLSLAQKTSKAIDATEDSYIDGLTFGDMYNSETKDIYGKEPLYFIYLRNRKRAYIPDENGRMGEQIDYNDVRTNWPTKEQADARRATNPKGCDKPEGVKVIDAVVLLLLPDGPQLACITFKSKSFGAGQSLLTFVNMVKGPAFAARFKIAALLDSNDAGKFAKFAVLPAGKPSTEDVTYAEAMYEMVKDKVIALEEAEVVEGEPVEQVRKADNVPF